MEDLFTKRVAERVARLDAELLDGVDRETARGVRRARGQLHCRKGCTPCCVGVFDITALDAWRLRRGLAELRGRHPAVAAGIVERAESQWRKLVDSFPGDPAGRALADDDAAREAFFATFDRLPCPALDPGTGACLVYAHRPLSCRTYGLPVRHGEGVLPPCQLNFGGASDGPAVAAAAIRPDPEDREGEILCAFAACGAAADTTVAAALAPRDGGD